MFDSSKEVSKEIRNSKVQLQKIQDDIIKNKKLNEELEAKIRGKSILYFSPTGKLELGEGLWTFDEFNKFRGDYVKMCIDLMKSGHFPV